MRGSKSERPRKTSVRRLVRIDSFQRSRDHASVGRPHEPRDFLAVAQKDERRPQFHAIGAPERPTVSIGNVRKAPRWLISCAAACSGDKPLSRTIDMMFGDMAAKG